MKLQYHYLNTFYCKLTNVLQLKTFYNIANFIFNIELIEKFKTIPGNILILSTMSV